MNKENDKINEYVDWHLFEDLPKKTIKTIYEENNHETTLINYIKHFICEAPVGSGKSTAIIKWIYNTIPKNKFILIVPTVNIANEFYNKLNESLKDRNISNNELEASGSMSMAPGQSPTNLEIKLCIKDNAFEDFEKAIKDFCPVVISTYYTASRCLGCVIESFYTELKSKVGLYKSREEKLSGFDKQRLETEHLKITEEYTLLIDEAHLLLENNSLIEMCREFDNVGLISATIKDISCFSVFRDYKILKPLTSKVYERNIYIHKLEPTNEQQRKKINENINEYWSKSYDKILIKIEDKKECDKLKEELNNDLQSKTVSHETEIVKALYYSDKKEVEINTDGKFESKNNPKIIIATSCIQAGQSITEQNMLSVFIQTQLDSGSSVQQFIGRNRNEKSDVHLYLRLTNDNKNVFINKFKKLENRYKTRLYQLQLNAWMSMSVESWKKYLSQMGNIIIDKELLEDVKKEPIVVEPGTSGTSEETTQTDDMNNKNNFVPSDKDLQKEFRGKKLLYKYFKIKSLNYIPKDYTIKTKVINEKGKRTRVYRLVKV